MCGTKMRTAAANVGKRARCPRCGSLVAVVAGTAKGAQSGASSSAVRPSVPSAPATARSAVPSTVRSDSARPLVVARPAALPPVQAVPADPLDPLGFGELNLPAVTMPATSAWSPAYGYGAAGRRKSPSLKWLWIGLGSAAVGMLGLICVGMLVFFLSKSARMTSLPGGMVASGGSAASNSGPKKVPSGPPVSEGEAEAVVQRFVTAVKGRDFNLCKHLFNVDRIFEEIADEAQMSGAERRGFLDGARRQPQFWEQIHPVVISGGEYVLLRPIRRAGEVRVVVRLSSEQIGLNYHEFILRRNEKQEAELADVYLMAAGNTLSESLRQVVLTMMAGRNSSLLGRFGADNRKIIDSGKKLDRIKTLSRSAPQLALGEFKSLPPELQRDKTIMVLKLQVCAAVSPSEYAVAFEEFSRAFPGDPCLDLLSIDYHIDRDDDASAIASAERLNAHVGGDPLLEKLIANLRSQ